MLLELLVSLLIKIYTCDLNCFIFQFVVTIIIALASLYFIRNTSSNHFVIDSNFDSFGSVNINGDSTSPVVEMASPQVVNCCVICSRSATKHCSGCKLVRYCSAACQIPHWNSEHKKTCKSLQLSSKTNSKQSGGPQIFATNSSKNLNDPKEVLFPYEEFVQLLDWEIPGNPPCGLLNCGNSCFANVVLQCLASTRPLVAYLLEKGHQKECRRNYWCFMCELQSHVARATQTLQPFSPLNILSRLPNIGGNLGCGKQEDAHEFMRFAIDTMQSVCLDEYGGEKAVHPRAQETTLIQYIFGGHLQSQVICTKCENVSNQFENMMDLTVEMQGDAASLEECLDQFTIAERLHGDNMYKCDGCNDYVLAWKRLTIRQAPNILTIALKRFQSGRFGKLNKRVSFPETLDLSPYMSEAGSDGDVYKLYAVVVHVDMLNASYFGHYICYTKDFSGNWYRINDCKVHRVELEEVLSQGAYMLLYSRVCARTSCLKTMEPARKHGEEKLKAAQEVVPDANQVVENFSIMNSTDVSLVSGLFLSDTISQSMSSGCEDAKEDVHMVDSEVSSSALKDDNMYGTGCCNAAEHGVSALQISQEPEVSFPLSNVENKDEAFESCAKQHVVMDSLDSNIGPYTNGVCENGVAAHDDAFASTTTGEVLNESHRYNAGVKTKKVKESGNGKLPSHITDVGVGKDDGRKSSGPKPKPLFAPGFLQTRPLKKYSKEEVNAPVQTGQLASVCNLNGETDRCSDSDLSNQNDGGPHISSDFFRKQTVNSEERMVKGKLSDSPNISQMRSSVSPHVSFDSLDIGNNSSSGENSIPVGDACTSSSTTGVVSDEAHCVNPKSKPEKIETDKGLPSLFGTGDVLGVGKDGTKYLGSELKPLFRPGFLGKHPRKKHSKQEAVVPPEICHASFDSACKVNAYSSNKYVKPGISYQSMGNSKDGESHIGEYSIPVGDGCASSSTTGVASDEAHCVNPKSKPEKMETDKGLPSLLGTGDVGLPSLLGTGDVLGVGKDGTKYLGSKLKPLFRPGFLGKHPREKFSKQEAVVPPEICHATFDSACKLNGYSSNMHVKPDISYQSMGNSEDGESHIGNSSSDYQEKHIINPQDEDHLRKNFQTLM